MSTSPASAPPTVYAIDGVLLADFIKNAEQDATEIVRKSSIVQGLHTYGRPNNSVTSDAAATIKTAALWTGALTKIDSKAAPKGFSIFGERIRDAIDVIKKAD